MLQFDTIKPIDYGLIALYLGIIVWVGFFAARQNKSADDYFRGGGRVPWLLAGVSNWVSGFSTYMFVVAAGFTYRYGIGALAIYTSGLWAYLAGAWLFAPRWRRARIRAPLEFLTRRYSRGTLWFYSVTSIGTQVAVLGYGIYVLCLFGSTALGLNNTVVHGAGFNLAGWQLCTLIVGAVLILYSMLGGMWAAVLSDSLQSIIILVMTIVICPVAYLYLGQGAGLAAGFTRMIREVPEGYLTRMNGPVESPLFVGCWIFSALVGLNTNWGLVQRYHSVADERSARRMALLCAALALVGPLLWILPSMASRVIFPDIAHAWSAFPEPTEASFVGIALTLLPHGLIGFVVSAILSATLGADNATLNWLSATVTQDLYSPLCRRLGAGEPGERTKLRVARLTILVLGTLGVVMAFQVPRFGGAFRFVSMLSTITVGFAMPVGLGLLYRRTPWWSAIAACMAFLVAIGACEWLGVAKGHEFVRNMLIDLTVGPAVFFGSAWWWNPADPANAGILALDADLGRPVQPEIGEAVARGGAKFFNALGVMCLVLGGVLVACRWIVSSTPIVSSNLNVIAGAMLLALGLGLRRVARPPKFRS